MSPDLIAEELSEEALSQYGASDSVARRVARESKCRHAFVDPDSSERNRLGIKAFKEIAEELGGGPVLRKQESARVHEIDNDALG